MYLLSTFPQHHLGSKHFINFTHRVNAILDRNRASHNNLLLGSPWLFIYKYASTHHTHTDICASANTRRHTHTRNMQVLSLSHDTLLGVVHFNRVTLFKKYLDPIFNVLKKKPIFFLTFLPDKNNINSLH